MVNSCHFIGHLGHAPEIKALPNGDSVANFSVACTESWKGKDGEKHEETTWVKCVAFRRLAEIIGEHLDKGSKVYVEGKMKNRQCEDKDGNKRTTTEIVVNEMKMLSFKGSGQGDQQQAEPQESAMGSDTPF